MIPAGLMLAHFCSARWVSYARTLCRVGCQNASGSVSVGRGRRTATRSLDMRRLGGLSLVSASALTRRAQIGAAALFCRSSRAPTPRESSHWLWAVSACPQSGRPTRGHRSWDTARQQRLGSPAAAALLGQAAVVPFGGTILQSHQGHNLRPLRLRLCRPASCQNPDTSCNLG